MRPDTRDPTVHPLIDCYSRRTEDGDHTTSLADVDSLLRGFMSSHDVRHAVGVQEVLDRLVAIADGSRTSFTFSKSSVVQSLLLLVLRRIRPQQVVRQLLDLLRSLVVRDHSHRSGAGDLVDALQSAFRGRERPRDASVDAEDHIIDGGGEGEVIEDGVGHRPDVLSLVHSVATLQLAEEAAVAVVGLPAVHSAKFVVSAKQENLVGQHDFLRE